MTGEHEIPPVHGSHLVGEDTVELELTVSEQLVLARAAEVAMTPVVPYRAGYDTFVYTRTRRADVAGTITFAALVCGITAAVGWHALVAEPSARAIATTAVIQSAPAVRVEPPPPAVVQVQNPFDATEIFEFPAETSEAEARTAIAELLLQRARERRQQGFDLSRASRHHARAVAPVNPSDVFVTKLLSPASRFSDTPGPRSGTPE
jgi:hypothetical protein